MMTIREANQFLRGQLTTLYEAGEATAISDHVLEFLLGKNHKQLIREDRKKLSPEQEGRLTEILNRLLKYEPVQYVLNEAWFCGLKFYVDRNVLIPRPETEELVEWIITDCKFPVKSLDILDIGAGSGCIPITLKRRIRKANVWSCDISASALEVANKNAEMMGTDVHFIQIDFLDKTNDDKLGKFDIIVSNPPYVPFKNKEQMLPNVVNYEPHTALFVKNNDPLIFYQRIAEFGQEHLNKGGSVYLEMHEDYGEEIKKLFTDRNYSIELRNDMQGKDRMARARKMEG